MIISRTAIPDAAATIMTQIGRSIALFLGLSVTRLVEVSAADVDDGDSVNCRR